MSNMKEIMVKGMNKVMLDCDTATFLSTKNSVERLGCVQRMQLKLHLMGCKFCRTFADQSNIISEELKTYKETDPDHFRVKLTDTQKEKLEKTVNDVTT